MISPKYDLNNYIRHQSIPVITDNQKVDKLLKSDLLRVKWWHNPTSKLAFNNAGYLRIHLLTPLGKLRPIDYPLIVDKAKDTYIQFLQIQPRPAFDYEIEIISPIGMTRSIIEIWEYNPSQNLPDNMAIHQPHDDSQLIAAIAANTAATVAADVVEELVSVTNTYSTSPQRISEMRSDMRGIIISTQTALARYRIFVGDSLTAAPTFESTGYQVELIGKSASYELENGFNSNVWVVSDLALNAVFTATLTSLKPPTV